VSEEFATTYRLYLGKAQEEMEYIRQELEACERCGLEVSKDAKVMGSGFPLSDIMLVKSRLFQEETERGVAFYGEAADVVEKACQALDHLKFEYLYGTNAIKCHLISSGPSSSSEPSVRKNCSLFLKMEILTCQPRFILAMGQEAIEVLNLISPSLGDRLEFQPGSIFNYRPKTRALVTYDLLESLEDMEKKKQLWTDLKKLDSLYGDYLSQKVRSKNVLKRSP
jgi:uracil-DNA glycosylase family 4